MQNGWFKIHDEGFNQIIVEISSKKIPLRFTVYQQERLLELQEKREEELKNIEENTKNVLKLRAEDDLNTCFIALNPLPDKVDFTKEDINLFLDLDQQRLLASIWMGRKVLSPSINPIHNDLEASKKGNE